MTTWLSTIPELAGTSTITLHESRVDGVHSLTADEDKAPLLVERTGRWTLRDPQYVVKHGPESTWYLRVSFYMPQPPLVEIVRDGCVRDSRYAVRAGVAA